MEGYVVTISFRVPAAVKAAFDKTFSRQNQSAIIAELMRRAVREHEAQARRERLFQQLATGRASRPSVSAADIRRARTTDRP